ncbi:MAG TPA: TPM domain-containing protein, partial [candidate division WOR-3 bacterium]|nr:TPM domain-containing protein [candidate division WOR-3 bacterium]
MIAALRSLFLILYLQLPNPVGYVNDFAGIIDPQWESKIEAVIQEVKDKTGAEIAVVTVNSIEPYGTIEEYAVKLFEKWGIGEEEKDNGVLVVVALDIRKVRIEVGYGLEGAIPDGFAGEIIRKTIVPFFRKGSYGEGLYYGVLRLARRIAGEYNVELEGTKGVKVPGEEPGVDKWQLIKFLIFLFFFFPF